jgi:SNF2 family DNA or RNA helicase
MHYAALATTADKYASFKSSDGKSLRKYQIDGVKFLEESNANAILADEQGLGKTVQIQALLSFQAAKLLPAILVCPTTVKLQWFHETIRWNGTKYPFTVQVINNGNEIAIPGFGIYVTTYDLLKKSSVFDMLNDVKTIILDECQRIKNHLSDRAKAVQDIVRNKNIAHVLPLSGTPIMNHAGEYFTVLNLVNSTKFPHHGGYVTQYCDFYEGGYGTKIGGIRDIEKFKADTKGIILRRTKAEVLPDLPSLDRKFFHVAFDNRFKKAYSAALEELNDVLYADNESEFTRSTLTIAIMSKMRKITGISKVDTAVDFATEFLLSCDRKLTIFTHHIDVANLIVEKLKSFCLDGGFESPLHLHSGLDGDARANLVQRFQSSGYRILVASTKAAGEGVNLQFCHDAILLERQWNPANEEQVEGRFHRFGQLNPVSFTYMIAVGTIDEYFTELVESKRAIVAATMDGKEIQWNEQSLMKELAHILVSEGRKKWTL